MRRLRFIGLIIVGIMGFSSCQKSAVDSGSPYVPSAADVTPTATLDQLTRGRSIYMNNCGRCHSLYSPDAFVASAWQSIVPNMASRAGLSATEQTLVLKYVTRGK
jgi:hypothetical protein